MLATDPLLAALTNTRERTVALVAPVADADLEWVHSKLMSPLVWDLGHIAAFEDLWLAHRYGGRPLLREALMDVYDAFETPRAGRGSLPFLRSAAAREYLAEVRGRTLDVLEQLGPGDGVIAELVIRHELQHTETMLQALVLARLSGYELPGSRQGDGTGPLASAPLTGLELIEVPAGPCTIGAQADGFAYDNERPRHRSDIRGYLMGRSAITSATYLTFVEGGGYKRREWWSDEGWAWKEQYDITRPGGWTKGLDGEWCVDGLHPLHSDEPVRPGLDANVDQIVTGPRSVDAHPDGVSPCGCEGMIGDTWEWTSSNFSGYAGFAAHPYREYSEAFFGPDHKVLRGGAWATGARLITAAFRNWDFPQRRQIFSGIRIARDL